MQALIIWAGVGAVIGFLVSGEGAGALTGALVGAGAVGVLAVGAVLFGIGSGFHTYNKKKRQEDLLREIKFREDFRDQIPDEY